MNPRKTLGKSLGFSASLFVRKKKIQENSIKICILKIPSCFVLLGCMLSNSITYIEIVFYVGSLISVKQNSIIYIGHKSIFKNN